MEAAEDTDKQQMNLGPGDSLQQIPEESSDPLDSKTPSAKGDQEQPQDQKKSRKQPTKRKLKHKKLDTACVYCRRSHMICDEGRPCQRCIKRNIGHLCHDEPASKAKKPRKQGGTGTKVAQSDVLSDGQQQQQQQQQQQPLQQQIPQHQSPQQLPPPQQMIPVDSNPSDDSRRAPNEANVNLDEGRILGLYNHRPTEQSADSIGYEHSSKPFVNPASAAINQRPFFYSEHAGSEFNSLTEFLSMIDDTDVINSINMNNDPMLHKLETASALGYSTHNSSVNLNGQQFDSAFFNNLRSGGKSSISLQAQTRGDSGSVSQTSLVNNFPAQGGDSVNYQFQQLPPDGSSQRLAQGQSQQVISAGQSQSQIRKVSSSSLPYVSDAARDKFFLTAADPTTEISPEERLKQVINAKLEAGLLKPYNYAKGYQRLQNYMDNHMAVSSRQRILKPLSTFRPGFRAIAKTLKDIDLILVEENFERMLLDYDRVFTSMAIPACLWRRTGEIYRGNKEFASLVEVSIDDLKNGKLAIYELMTEESSVNFWEKYGAIAFDKTQKAVLTSCNLRTKDGLRKKNCCFSFTIRRDRYNIPSCIVGNFIPIQ
ncbi:DEKNAAC100890 [Brettanomyces naardenensis]|uniref:DEKNAAC100890 n=1 Tax=Brettanomyces naardenensis TaxID=13370 RepID=A0A448YFC9_BRENA|nr:DEKNAAC100890 [Brettanomyces naardenensis]